MTRLGTDIVYIPRIQAIVDRFGDRFLQRVYTLTEQKDCGYESRSRSSIHRLAGRWAAKEAVVKALGTGWSGIKYTDIEIQRQPSGAPVIHLHPRAMAVACGGEWHLSLSHDGDYAIATALLVSNPSLSLPGNKEN